MRGDSQGPGVWGRVRARPILWSGGAAALVAAVAVVLVWFQPQALLYDTTVDEELPGAAPAGPGDPEPEEGDAAEPGTDPAPELEADAAAEEEPAADAGGDAAGDPDGSAADGPGDEDTDAAAADEPDEPAGPEPRLTGAFESRNRYTVEGDATIYRLEDGSDVLRLEDFESTNGPDLYVYLVAGDTSESDAELASDFVDLGVLKGNVGNQNYELPDDVDLDRYDTVLIWCERFTVGFGAADLAPSE